MRGVQQEVSLTTAVEPGAGEVAPVVILQDPLAVTLLLTVLTTFNNEDQFLGKSVLPTGVLVKLVVQSGDGIELVRKLGDVALQNS